MNQSYLQKYRSIEIETTFTYQTQNLRDLSTNLNPVKTG